MLLLVFRIMSIGLPKIELHQSRNLTRRLTTQNDLNGEEKIIGSY